MLQISSSSVSQKYKTWFIRLNLGMVQTVMELYLSKMSPARARWVLARPQALLDRAWAWAEIPLPRKIFLGLSLARNTVLCYSMRG
jgi:hypothetical protein